MSERPGHPSAANRHRSGTLAWRLVFPTARFDIVTLVTAYLVALLFIPSSLIFSPLGGIGTPAMILSSLYFSGMPGLPGKSFLPEREGPSGWQSSPSH